MGRYIGLGDVYTKKLISPIVFSISRLVCNCLTVTITKDSDKRSRDLLSLWVMYLAEFSCIVIYLIENQCFPFRKSGIKRNLRIYRDKKRTKKDIFIICLLIFSNFLLDGISTVMQFSLQKSFLYSITDTLFLIFTTFLTMYWLRYTYHKYHVVGIFIYLVACGVLIALEIINNGISNTQALDYAYLFIYPTLKCFRSCFQKYLMDSMFISPFIMLFAEGTIGLFVIPIIYFSSKNSCKSYFDVEEIKDDYCKIIAGLHNFRIKEKDILATFILRTITIIPLNVFELKVVQDYTPCHQLVSFSFTRIFQWIIFSIISGYDGYKKKYILYLAGVCYIIEFIAGLIYFDFIVLHFCKLDFYSRVSILKRNKIEEISQQDEILDYIQDMDYESDSKLIENIDDIEEF